MKLISIKSLATIACLPLLFGGCMKNFDDIFDGNAMGVLEPVVDFGTYGSALNSEMKVDPMALRTTISFMASSKKETQTHGEDYAYVINDASLLQNYVEESGKVHSWPEIDFDKYSLVVGSVYVPGADYFVERHRIREGIKSTKLYVDIKIHRDGGYTQAFMYKYIVALYPKLKDQPVKVLTQISD